MVLHKTLNLARATLTKTLSHGYAQSVVAATQTSYAANNNSFAGPRYNKSINRQHHVSTTAPHKDVHHESSLAAYYSAWQKSQKIPEKEWSQFQFPKLLEWTQPTPSEQRTQGSAATASAAAEDSSVRPTLVRSQSANVVEDLQSATAQEEHVAKDAQTHSNLDTASMQYNSSVNGATQSSTTISSRTPNPEDASHEETRLTEAEFFTRELQLLAETGKYTAIPAVFESMLERGITPESDAYDHLLAAALYFPATRAESTKKALDVYTDIIRRKVTPSPTTFNVLIELLCKNAIEAASVSRVSEERGRRYHGLLHDQETKPAFPQDMSTRATELFDQACTLHAGHVFRERMYSLLVAANSEYGNVQDMVRVYSRMEQHNIIPRADTFISMINGFARTGDLTNTLEAYNEYKEFAIAHNEGNLVMSRKDDEVHAALIRAFTSMKMPESAAQFLSKLELVSEAQELADLRNIIALKGFIPEWLQQGYYAKAFEVANFQLTGPARTVALAAVCVRTADNEQPTIASEAFALLGHAAGRTSPAIALGAMHLRFGNLAAAEPLWSAIDVEDANSALVDYTTAFTVVALRSDQASLGLQRARLVFSKIRTLLASTPEAQGLVQEACMTIARSVASEARALEPASFTSFLRLMNEHAGGLEHVADDLLNCLNPALVDQIEIDDLRRLAELQARLINNNGFGTVEAARLANVVQVLTERRAPVDSSNEEHISRALLKTAQLELQYRWQQRALVQHVPTAIASDFSPTLSFSRSSDDGIDPYNSSVDLKGSAMIVEALELNHGNPTHHLMTAMNNLRVMHRQHRHPRYYAYGKLIQTAAKVRRLDVAEEVLALARQDIPCVPEYHVVRHGWANILDSMVSACLTAGRRDLAEKYHAELLAIGSAPSANTYGQYITSLKETSSKNVDEASEALSIFQRARMEGVEPSSFLYNVLIGKLGKARRIDDCLHYYREMRALGIHPTSVTYGTIINALCRVSDQNLAEQLFDEMERMPNYKARPAPYHSIMQYFLNTKRDRSKVLQYYSRMQEMNIEHTAYTYKLLIDTYATIEPVNMVAAQNVIDTMGQQGCPPDSMHYSALVHAKGCIAKDMEGARAVFNAALSQGGQPQPCLFQALVETMVANDNIKDAEALMFQMQSMNVEMTPYIANALISGFSAAGDISSAEKYYNLVSRSKREPSLYEAMTRAYVVHGLNGKAVRVVQDAAARGYPPAVQSKISALISGSTVA